MTNIDVDVDCPPVRPVENPNASYRMVDGTETKALFVKNFSMGDWELLTRIKDLNGHLTHADALRWAVRKAAGVIG